MYGIIYKATFPNGKVYIGQTTKDLEMRKKRHYAQMKSSIKDKKDDSVLMRAFKKYGFEKVKWEIIDTAFTKEELNQKEIYWINFYKSYIKFENSNGYNSTLGGDSPGNKLMNLNDKQLYECGLEIKQGKSKKYIKEKYHLTDSSYLEISRGKRWSFYTKIAPFDEHIDESNTVVNRYQVDKIIFLFKHKQTIKDISKEIGISYNTIVKILKGEMWRNYTGIIDESFYIFYSNKQKEEETNKILYIIELNKNGKTYKEISDLMGMPLSTIKGILSGRTHSDITKIKWKPGKERMDNGEFKNLKLNKNKVLKIIELNKNGKSAKDIAELLQVKREIILNVLNGYTWSHITGIKQERKKVHRLTENDVLDIIKFYNNGKSIDFIAKSKNTTSKYIKKILNGERWNNITHIK